MIAQIFSRNQILNSALNDSCYEEFLAYCRLENKVSNSCEYQADEIDDSLIEKNYEDSSDAK